MKIDIAVYPISMIGGIRTLSVELKKGLEENGVDCDIIYLSKSGSVGKRGENAFATKFYGYGKEKELKAFAEYAKKCDAIIWMDIPHKNKSFNETDWQKCFLDDVKNIVIYHDTLATSYAWVSHIADKIYAHVGVQEKTEYSFEKLKYDDFVIIRHPLGTDYDNSLYQKKEDIIIAPHQWKSWKRMQILIQSCVQQKYPTYTFNCGIIRRKMSSTQPRFAEEYKIWKGSIDSGKHIYAGFVSFDVLEDYFRRAKTIIDISRGELGSRTNKPNMNYSMLEGMLHRCMPVISYHQRQFPHFPSENKYMVDEGDLINSIAKMNDLSIEEYNTPEAQKVLDLNQKFVVDHFNRKKIAAEYIALANAPRKKTMGRIEFSGKLAEDDDDPKETPKQNFLF